MIGCICCHGPLDGNGNCPMCDWKIISELEKKENLAARISEIKAECRKGADEIALKFHNTYERLAPRYGYKTRSDTRQFDPATPNGMLMIAVCEEVCRRERQALLAAIETVEKWNRRTHSLLDDGAKADLMRIADQWEANSP